MNYYKYAYINPETNTLAGEYIINPSLIPETSLLRVLHDGPNNVNGVIYTDDPNIEYIAWYIDDMPIVSNPEHIQVLDYWGVYRDYDTIYKDEKYMRMNMYNPEFEEHKMNTDPYYRLHAMNTFADDYQVFAETYTKPEDLLRKTNKGSNIQLVTQDVNHIPPYDIVIEHLGHLNFLFNSANMNDVDILVAGEHIYKILTGRGTKQSEQTLEVHQRFNTTRTEIDIFIIESDPRKIANYINAIGRDVKSMYSEYNRCAICGSTDIERSLRQVRSLDEVSIYVDTCVDCRTILVTQPVSLRYTRSTRYVSIAAYSQGNQLLKLNIILKMYRTYSEVLHGFDVDCACIGYDGLNIWATERARYALFHGYNTINVDFISRQYKIDLIAYGILGMDIDYSNAETQRSVNSSDELVSTIRILKDSSMSLSVHFVHPSYIEDAKSYALFLDDLRNTGRYQEVLPQLQEIATNDGWDDDTVWFKLQHAPYNLPDQFQIMIYDTRSSINIIATMLKDGDIVDLLTINKTVYKMMQVTNDVLITQDVRFVFTEPGQEITNTFEILVK